MRRLQKRRYETAVAAQERKNRRGSSEGAAALGQASTPPGGNPALADPLSPERVKSVLVRLGIPLLVIWIVGGLIAAFSISPVIRTVALGIPANQYRDGLMRKTLEDWIAAH